MGLLDDVLGQLTGGEREANASATRSQTGGSGMGGAMAALLPVVLQMLASSGRGQQPGRGATTGGGLEDLLGQVLGGQGTSGAGGLADLLAGFQRAGFGNEARSWVSTVQNLPVPPEALEQVFGRGGIAEIARRAGLSEQDATRGLSQLMPEVVDRVTPSGEVPDASSLLASVDAMAKRLGVP